MPSRPHRSAVLAETRVVAARRQLTANLSGEAVMLGLDDGIYYGLDGAGARLWALIQEPATIATVAEAISGEYAVDRDTALRDLIELARDLLDRGLIDIVPETAA